MSKEIKMGEILTSKVETKVYGEISDTEIVIPSDNRVTVGFWRISLPWQERGGSCKYPILRSRDITLMDWLKLSTMSLMRSST